MGQGDKETGRQGEEKSVGAALRLPFDSAQGARSGTGTRDGLLTEKENSLESDKGTRRRGDKGTRILLTGFLLTC